MKNKLVGHGGAARLFKGLLAIVLVLGVMPANLSLPAQAFAATTTVETTAELQTAVSGATEDTVITLGDSYPLTSGTVALTVNHDYNVTIDGGGKTLGITGTGRHFTIDSSGGHAGSVTFENITFQGNGTLGADGRPVYTAFGGGVAVTDNKDVGIDLTFDNVVFNDNRAGQGSSHGGAVYLSRNINATFRNSSFNRNASPENGGAIATIAMV